MRSKTRVRQPKPKKIGWGRYAKARALGFRSMFEVDVFRAAEEEGLELQYEGLKLPYSLEKYYIPDLILPNGILIEVKGRFTEEDRRKMISVRDQHPDRDIRFVFQKAHLKLTKAKKSKTYSEWAELNDFQWAEGSIPLSWWKEKKKDVVHTRKQERD